jgi:signal transduction histidine kinase
MEAKTAIPEFLSGGGEMGQRIREYDWSATPLGPIDSWPQNLRTCLRIMLASRQPIWIGWGKELIKLYNDPYRAIVGGKHPLALGLPASAVWKAIWREIGPMLETVMEKDEGTYAESQLLIMERNGYPEETYYTFSYTPIPGDDGVTAGMICFNVDDTDRILGGRQLQTLTRLGKYLAECHDYSSAMLQTISTLFANPADFPFGLFYSVKGAGAVLEYFTELGESARHTPVSLAFDADDALARAMREASATRSMQLIERLEEAVGSMPRGIWAVPPDRAVVAPIFLPGAREATAFLVMGINPYRLPDERYLNFCGTVTDQVATTFADIYGQELERKRSEALLEIDRAKTLFFSNISHEFRTPLTLLLGPIEDLLNDPASLEVNRYRLGVAYRNALRMQKLVNTLLEFSRLEAGRLEGQFQRVDIAELTLDLASSFRSAVEKGGMVLRTSAGEVGGEVFVDTEFWERIILNLVSNAFKYSEEGAIDVDVGQVGSAVRVRVTDTGVGIAADQLEKIFDRFHRIENSGGRSLEGTGIGLAMVRELVWLHGGTIGVESELGKGSTFTVILPTGSDHLPAGRILYEPAAVARQTRQVEAFVQEAGRWADDARPTVGDVAPSAGDVAPGREAGGSKRYTVLLADDNADMREYVERLLSPQFTVITARDGQDALEKMLEHAPDLVLTDVMMPRLDGFSLLKLIRETPELQQVPVILLSARAGEEAKIEGLAAGADDYLVKPFGARELLARVDSNIRIARDRRAAMLAYAEKLEQAVRRRTQELRKLNHSLESSNEDLQQFAHVASHDLKEPVRKIRTFTGRLLEEYANHLPQEALSFLQKILQATIRMGTMIEGVLTYSNLNSDEQPMEAIDLNEVFVEIESELELVINETGAEIRRGELPRIEGARVLIYQLFYNLINNALKFSRNADKPLIVIESRVGQGAGKRIAELIIRDNGIGFDMAQAGKIFEAFARLNSKDRFEGTGLGLALCKKIAERHHGSISATGVKDEGAVFVVRLPLTQMERSI